MSGSGGIRSWGRRAIRVRAGEQVLRVACPINIVLCRDDPAILSWELANEARCEGDVSGNTLTVRWDLYSGFRV